MRHYLGYSFDTSLLHLLQLLYFQLSLIRYPRKLGNVAIPGLIARGTATYRGAMPDDCLLEPDPLLFAACLIQCDIAMPIHSLHKYVQAHPGIIHRGVPNKSPRELIRLIMNIERARAAGSRTIKDPELHRGGAERECVNESSRRLACEDASHVARKLEKIRLEPTPVVRFLLLSDDQDVLVFEGTVRVCDGRLDEEIHLAFPLLELVHGSGCMELVWCIG